MYITTTERQLMAQAFPHVQDETLRPVHSRSVQIDVEASFARIMAIAKEIDPLAWDHGYARSRLVSLRIAAKIVAGYPELAKNEHALIDVSTGRLPGEPVPEPVVIVPFEQVTDHSKPQPKPSIFARLAKAWRNSK